jgi:hypothetical protein
MLLKKAFVEDECSSLHVRHLRVAELKIAECRYMDIPAHLRTCQLGSRDMIRCSIRMSSAPHRSAAYQHHELVGRQRGLQTSSSSPNVSLTALVFFFNFFTTLASDFFTSFSSSSLLCCESSLMILAALRFLAFEPT